MASRNRVAETKCALRFGPFSHIFTFLIAIISLASVSASACDGYVTITGNCLGQADLNLSDIFERNPEAPYDVFMRVPIKNTGEFKKYKIDHRCKDENGEAVDGYQSIYTALNVSRPGVKKYAIWRAGINLIERILLEEEKAFKIVTRHKAGCSHDYEALEVILDIQYKYKGVRDACETALRTLATVQGLKFDPSGAKKFHKKKEKGNRLVTCVHGPEEVRIDFSSKTRTVINSIWSFAL